MKDQIRIILQPYFKEFQTVRDEFDQFAFTQYVLETGTKIFQLYQDYGLEKFDKNEIAEVWNELYQKNIIENRHT